MNNKLIDLDRLKRFGEAIKDKTEKKIKNPDNLFYYAPSQAFLKDAGSVHGLNYNNIPEGGVAKLTELLAVSANDHRYDDEDAIAAAAATVNGIMTNLMASGIVKTNEDPSIATADFYAYTEDNSVYKASPARHFHLEMDTSTLTGTYDIEDADGLAMHLVSGPAGANSGEMTVASPFDANNVKLTPAQKSRIKAAIGVESGAQIEVEGVVVGDGSGDVEGYDIDTALDDTATDKEFATAKATQSRANGIEDIIAPRFDKTATYEKGDLVIYDNKLYQADDDIEAGDWDEAEWSLTKISQATSTKAKDVTIEDEATRYDSENVEDALKEISERTGYIDSSAVIIDETFECEDISATNKRHDFGRPLVFMEGKTYTVTINGATYNAVAFNDPWSGVMISEDGTSDYECKFTITPDGWYECNDLEGAAEPVVMKVVGPGVVRMPKMYNSIQNIEDGDDEGIQMNSCHATGKYAVALGFGTTASKNYSFAEGAGSTASGVWSHAEGCATTASKEGAHSEGGETKATGLYSHAEGTLTQARELATHAEGQGTIATGDDAHASQHVQGNFNVVDAAMNYIDIVGNGTLLERKNIEATTFTGDKKLKGDVYVHANDDSTGGMKVVTAYDFTADYDKTATYNTGDTAIYDFKVYKAKEDAVTGDWNADKWEEVEVKDIIGGHIDEELLKNPAKWHEYTSAGIPLFIHNIYADKKGINDYSTLPHAGYTPLNYFLGRAITTHINDDPAKATVMMNNFKTHILTLEADGRLQNDAANPDWLYLAICIHKAHDGTIVGDDYSIEVAYNKITEEMEFTIKGSDDGLIIHAHKQADGTIDKVEYSYPGDYLVLDPDVISLSDTRKSNARKNLGINDIQPWPEGFDQHNIPNMDSGYYDVPADGLELVTVWLDPDTGVYEDDAVFTIKEGPIHIMNKADSGKVVLCRPAYDSDEPFYVGWTRPDGGVRWTECEDSVNTELMYKGVIAYQSLIENVHGIQYVSYDSEDSFTTTTYDVATDLADADDTDLTTAGAVKSYVADKTADIVKSVDGVSPDADGKVTLSAVRFTVQALTDAEKTQAKKNLDLDEVDNTADLDKPISTATQEALDLKVDRTKKGVGIAEGSYYADIKEWVTPGAVCRFVKLNEAGTKIEYATKYSEVIGVTVATPAMAGAATDARFNEDGTLKAEYAFVIDDGMAIVEDDGTAYVTDVVVPTTDGIATLAQGDIGFYVRKRIDGTHILISAMPCAETVTSLNAKIKAANALGFNADRINYFKDIRDGLDAVFASLESQLDDAGKAGAQKTHDALNNLINSFSPDGDPILYTLNAVDGMNVTQLPMNGYEMLSPDEMEVW